MPATLCLAFDIERSGPLETNQTIAVGACVMDASFNVLDTMLFCNYFPTEDVFEDTCWQNFWISRQPLLRSFVYGGSKTRDERTAEMIITFQKFRSKWEIYCHRHHLKMVLVSDNVLFDGGQLNTLIARFTDDHPLHYTVTKQLYSPVVCVYDMLKGFLLATSPEQADIRNVWKCITAAYTVPPSPVANDHNPRNDATFIAFQYQVFMAISRKEIRKKVTRK